MPITKVGKGIFQEFTNRIYKPICKNSGKKL